MIEECQWACEGLFEGVGKFAALLQERPERLPTCHGRERRQLCMLERQIAGQN
jgi:hypothetical protein